MGDDPPSAGLASAGGVDDLCIYTVRPLYGVSRSGAGDCAWGWSHGSSELYECFSLYSPEPDEWQRPPGEGGFQPPPSWSLSGTGSSVLEWAALGADSSLAALLSEHGAQVSMLCLAPGSAMPASLSQCMATPGAPFGRATSVVMEAVAARLEAELALGASLPATVAGPAPQQQPATVGAQRPKRQRKGAADRVAPEPMTPQLPQPSGLGEVVLSVDVEAQERRRQAMLLVDGLPVSCSWLMLDLDEHVWRSLSAARKAQLLERHLCTFSAGTLAACRRTLARLGAWLALQGLDEACDGFLCSGGLLCLFVMDAQQVSRSSGDSVPLALRSALTWGRNHAGLTGLAVYSDAFVNVASPPPKPPKAAVALTMPIFAHLAFVAVANPSAAVREYAAALVLCCLAALRVRDAQRARLSACSSSMVAGCCFTSKHPKRRSPVPMLFTTSTWDSFSGPWHASLAPRARAGEVDYLFRAVRRPRGVRRFDLPGVSLLNKPASSADVVAVMRFILTLPPLELTPAEAAQYSGHSMRHWLPTLARVLRVSEEDRAELARWAAQLDASAKKGSLPNRYSQEGAAGRVLEIQSRIFAAVGACLPDGYLRPEDDCLADAFVLPFSHAWPELASQLGVGPVEVPLQGGASPASATPAQGVSSSESDEE